jgi:hypothetical protein
MPPGRYERAIEYVQVRGRTKIAIRGTISEFIPNPTFDVLERPGAQFGLAQLMRVPV